MVIKVTYSDYEKEMKKARIDFENGQYFDISFADDEEDEKPVCPLPPTEGEDGEEGTEKKVQINTECIEEDPREIIISAIDEDVSLTIANKVDYDELRKIISLLQRFTKQM